MGEHSRVDTETNTESDCDGTNPPVDTDVLVTTARFRCLGRFGSDGQWHSACTGMLLPAVTAWKYMDGATAFVRTLTAFTNERLQSHT